jgi:putative tryptophan/tyrosine transport system substrate-binding protein
MRRRAFIAAFAASAATWPLTARAQQPIRRVAVLNPARDTDPEYQRRLGALTDALQKLGWTDGRNISIDIRWAGARPEEIQQIASSLVSLAPDIIIASGSVATAAVKRATPRISVLFLVVNEPVLQGFVPSLARPGGNMTGFTNVDFSVVGKMVELLRDMVPALHRIGLMFNSDAYPIYNNYLHTLQTEHRASVEVVRASVRSPAEIDAVIDGLTALPLQTAQQSRQQWTGIDYLQSGRSDSSPQKAP